MPVVPRELAEHTIDVNKGSKPIKQKLRRFAPDRKATIKKNSPDYWQQDLSGRY
jgi:hypothetical protein